MISYEIDESYKRTVGFSSLGVQNKYYKEGYWYKQNISGYEGKAEFVSNMLLKHSDIEDFVQYEECLINGKDGCRSKNFLQPGENFITFQRLYNLANGGELAEKVYGYREVSDRIHYVIDFIAEYTKVDCTSYLKDILNIDMLTINIDRHFHNLGLIQVGGDYKIAPYFDFGASFFSNQFIFNPLMSMEEKVQMATAKPFSGSFEQQAVVLGKSIILDYDGIMKDLEGEPCYIQEIVSYQLNRYKDYF